MYTHLDFDLWTLSLSTIVKPEVAADSPATSVTKELLDESEAFTPDDILGVALLPVVLLIGVISFVLLLVSTAFMMKASKMVLALKALERSQDQQKELLDLISEYR